MKLLKISIGNYRCFLDEPQGFNSWGAVNLIIGRNNSGKSRLLDLIRYACDQSSVNLIAPAYIEIEGELESEDLSPYFLANHSHGEIPGSHWEYGSKFIGAKVSYRVLGNDVLEVVVNGEHPTIGKSNFYSLVRSVGIPFAKKNYLHIAAERAISPEMESKDWILPSGVGATAVVQRYLMDSDLSSAVIEELLLKEVNAIFSPDNKFTRILIQRHADGRWEIYLEEQDKGTIPLSASGSGLQTVILTLLALHVIPEGQRIARSNMIVAIEEPENNLHPALQRRLLSYLQNYAHKHGCIFFITTHSTVAIDQFVGQKDAKLFHVRHDGKSAKVTNVQAYGDGHEVLRDLDIRASDLLQSNGIIWVEGPTDRLYINKWIEHASGGRIREGAHYQCVFYGGRLLSHLSASGNLSERKELIDLITINKNAAVVIDSDRRAEGGRLNTTKLRVKHEFEAAGALVWVTRGREIENYIHPRILKQLFSESAAGTSDKFTSVFDWITNDKKMKKTAPSKMALATAVTDLIVEVQELDVLDLEERLGELVRRIMDWNNMPTLDH